jgi:P-type E1-E2 ATPase
MAARHVLVKNLATIETLGCMTLLCTDKTGTLTEGKMVRNFPILPETALNNSSIRSLWALSHS